MAASVVYNFQIGTTNATYTGKGALNDGGTTFNRIDFSGVGSVNSVADAKDSNGVVSPGVGLTLVADGRFDAGAKNGFGDATPVSTVASDPIALLQNFATVRSGLVGTITLSGLPPHTPFVLYFYGTNGTFSDGKRGTKFTLFTNASLKTPAGSATTAGTQDTRFAAPDNYVKLTGTTDPGGNVFASYAGGVGDEGDFNGLQIQVTKP